MRFLVTFAAISFLILLGQHKCDTFYPEATLAFFFGPKYYTEYFAIQEFENVKLHPAFNSTKPSVLYIHGFRESVLADSVQMVVAAYLSRNDHNIFALDWSNYSSGSYVAHAVPSVIGLGNFIGYRMNTWLEQGLLDGNRLHIVGHSLGGQMSGYIGKMVNLLSRGTKRIKRITALDPAKPLFYTNRTAMISYIHSDDAELVDIIHTNAGVLGSSVSVGNCDFWPNGGTFQPGCAVNSIINCDHKRSWAYYAESVASIEPKFNAIVCEDYKNFKKLNCSDNLTSFMGFYARENCSGVYYLQTNNDFPYSRGVFGLLYSPLVDIDRQILLLEISFSAAQSSRYQDLQLLFVYGNDTTEFDAFYFNQTSQFLSHPNYSNDRATILYGYGFTENYHRKSTQAIVNAYIERGNHNIVVIEWSKYSGGNYYFEAIPNARNVGDEVGRQLWKMKEIGFNLDNFQLLGHSLGGQLIGYIGRSVYKYSSNTYKMPIITALDPAGPLLYGIHAIVNKPLNKDDAKIVQVIHTDSTFFGASEKSGTVDFWPNGGKNQPGCPRPNLDYNSEENFCSHRRSWMYFAESVRLTNSKTFYSVPCSTWQDFVTQNCPENTTTTQTFMGIDTNPNLTGDFFLQTNAQEPYSRGIYGIFYDETFSEV